MKKLLLIAAAISLGSISFAQKNKTKDKKENTKTEAREKILGKDKGTDKKSTQKKKDEDAIWEGTRDTDGGGPKPSKNQPAKVREAFKRDYPNAANVRWSKYRGDWTATFSNGLITSTAVYHANGERRDTRTQIGRAQLPKAIDEVLKKRTAIELGNIIKIEVPRIAKDVFRIKTIEGGTTRFSFYDANGQEVKYDY